MLSDAAVEAAARAMYAHDGGVGEFNLEVYEDYAKAMLEAAAPHLMAQAFSEGQQHRDEYGWSEHNPYRSAGAGE